MDDPQVKRSLADDPNFVASLEDLDHGLNPESEGEPFAPLPPHRERAPRAPAPPARPAAPPPPPARAARPAPPMTPLASLPPASLPPLTPEPRSRRPLLDLFPPEPGYGERPTGPIAGIAIAPEISRGHAPRLAVPTPPEAVVPTRPEAVTYETFYGLNEKPFSLSTDPRFLYHSAAHDEVAQTLLTAIRHRDGVVLVTGELGAGKTTLCRVVTEELDRRTLTSVVLEPLATVEDLIKTLLVDFGALSRDDLAYSPHATLEELSAPLRSFIASLASLQALAVVIIDEAQNLPIDVLQQIPLLAAAGEGSRLLQVVLVGQPTLTELLKRPELRLLEQDVAVRATLGPLAADEIAGYVMHRLGVAGSSSRVDFDDSALVRIHELSGGVPRVVNLLCDRAMSRGHELSANIIDGALIEAAADDLDLGPSVNASPGIVRQVLAVAALAALVLVGAAAALWVFRDAVARTVVQWEAVPPAPGAPIRTLPAPLQAIPPPVDAAPSVVNLQAPPRIG